MFVDLAADWGIPSEHGGDGGIAAHWMAEAGVLDLFLLLGPSPADVSQQVRSPPAACLGLHGKASMAFFLACCPASRQRAALRSLLLPC